MAAFSDGAFGKNTACSASAFDFGGAAVVVVTKGWPGTKKRKTDEAWREERDARDRLKARIRMAMDGPPHVAAAVQDVLSEYIAPQKSDARYVPLDARIRWDEIYRQLDLVEAQVLMHVAAAEDEDDEDWLLLNG